ncbi:MAG: hypothetical protein PUF72_09130 [Clostridiales bacterium]|nr:hypothetical protein [Clostridiales bacterium]
MIKKLFCLPPPLMLLIAIPSFALVFFVLDSGLDNHIVAYISYFLSAYAMRVLELMNCSIAVKSEINRGTEFTVRIPAKREETDDE